VAVFAPIVTKVFNVEGGYQNNPIDNGNYTSNGCGKQLIGTNHGIAAKTLEEYIQSCPSIDFMKNLTRLEAIQIYKTDFWDDIGGDYLNNSNVALVIFDTNVLRPVWVRPIVQEALVRQNIYDSCIKPFGIATINAINSANQDQLFNDLKEVRKAKHMSAYNSAATSGDTQSTSYKYKDGYLIRCDSLGGFTNFDGDYFHNYDLGTLDTPSTGAEVCELAESQDPSLLAEIEHIDNLGVTWWETNKLYILIPASVLFLGLAIYGFKKYW